MDLLLIVVIASDANFVDSILDSQGAVPLTIEWNLITYNCTATISAVATFLSNSSVVGK